MNVPEDLERLILDTRAKVRHGFPWWLKPILMRRVAGITIGRRVYLAAGTDIARALRHELVHVRQIGRLGFFTFYWRWIGEYIRNLRRGMPSHEAYRRISFEEEAFREETI